MEYSAVIAAVSTPPGKGGVAIIRISGDGALDIAKRVFRRRDGGEIRDPEPRREIWGSIFSGGEEIDDGMLCYFKAPASYTGEDTVEISCHGGVLVTRGVLEAVLAAGARPAEPGEFTRRAFINGKLSLSSAEAIGNLLEAKSREQIKLNSKKARGVLSLKMEELRSELLDILSSMYARIDYPDEDLGELSAAEIGEKLCSIIEKTDRLIASYGTGRAISEGISTVIAGKPNAGKSTLYNALLGEDAAIVSDVRGTTRDVLTSELPLGRLLLRISDTAGVRAETDDAIERIGIERSRERIRESELILALFDLSSPFSPEDEEIIRAISDSDARRIAILTKSDLKCGECPTLPEGLFDATLEASALKDPVSLKLELAAICDALFTDGKLSAGEDAIVSSARQFACLSAAREHLLLARDALSIGVYQDAAASDIELALAKISEIDTKAVSDDIVSDVFSKFCVGK